MALRVSSTDRDMPGMPLPLSPSNSNSNNMEQQMRLSFLPARPLILRKEISLSQQENLSEHLQTSFPVPPLQQPLSGNKTDSGKSPTWSLQLSPRLTTSSSTGEGASTGGNSAFAAALERMQQKGQKLLPDHHASSSHKQAARTLKQKEALERLNAMAPAEAAASFKRKQARRRPRTDHDETPQINATFHQTKGDDQQHLPLRLLDKLRIAGDHKDEEHLAAAASLILSKSTTSFPRSSSHRLLRMQQQKSSNPKLSTTGFGSSGRLPSTGRLATRRVRSSSRLLI